MADLVERLMVAIAHPAASPSQSGHVPSFEAPAIFSPGLIEDVLETTFGYWTDGMRSEAEGSSLEQLLSDAVRHALEVALADLDMTIDEALAGLEGAAVQHALEDALDAAIGRASDALAGWAAADAGVACADPALAAVMAALALPMMLGAPVTGAPSSAGDLADLALRAADGTSSGATSAHAAVPAPEASSQRGGGFHKVSRALLPLTDVLPPSPAKAMQGGAGAASGGAGGTALVAVPTSNELPDLTGGRVGDDDPSRIPESIPQDCTAHPN